VISRTPAGPATFVQAISLAAALAAAMIRRHKKWLVGAAAVSAAPMVLLLLVSIAAWQENLGNNGPPLPLSQGVFGVAFSPDGRTVAVINPNLEIWSVADPAHPRRLGYSKGDIVTGADPAFSPNGRVLATAGQQNVILWNVTDPVPRPAQIAVLSAYPSGVSAVLFSPDGHLLASASDNGTVVLRNLADPAAAVITATGRFPASPPPPPGAGLLPGAALAFSASGHTLTTIAGNSTVTVWNVTGSGGLTRVTTITTDSIGSGPVAFSSSGRAVAGAPTTGDTLALWTLP